MQAAKNSIPQHVSDTFPYKLLLNMPLYFQKKIYKKMSQSSHHKFSIIDANDMDRLKFMMIFKQMKQTNNFQLSKLNLSLQQSRSIATFLGLAICDALGASTQFIPFVKDRHHLIIEGFKDIQQKVQAKILDRRAGRIGIWTDDCSMALAMANSILLNDYKFDPVHIRYMFVMWLHHGLSNGGRKYSIGLGGNISISMNQFMERQDPYAQKGQEFNNGNGSLMRLAPIPIAYSNCMEDAIKYSEKQSQTTHNGKQAKQCAKLLAQLIVQLINRKDKDWRQTIDQVCQLFTSQVKSVQFLAKSKQQTQQMYDQSCSIYKKKFKMFNQSINDRNWNWKSPDFTYSPCRNKQQPGYIGSYCMDALSMALHTVWHTSSFKQCALWNANMGGDCDTVGAIAGQLSGAIYGISSQMLKLYSQMVDFQQERYQVFLIAYKLASKKKIGKYQIPKMLEIDEKCTQIKKQQKQVSLKSQKGQTCSKVQVVLVQQKMQDQSEQIVQK